MPDPVPPPAAYRERRRLQHRRINQRPKRCPDCLDVVQAGNLARHRRRHSARGNLDNSRRAA